MEYEIRYYFSNNKLEDIIEKLSKVKGLKKNERCYEKTTQFDHPSNDYSFYSKEIDGRFRVRITKSEKKSKCKLSWKRRIPATHISDVNKEEEVEVNINVEEYDNFMFIINNVLKMKSVESYERYRTTFTNDEIEVSVDEYPFGVALEIENKSETKDPEQNVKKWSDMLGLDIKNTYKLSWDDKYTELCNQQGIEHYNHVTFDKKMPQVLD